MSDILTIYCEGKRGSHDFDILEKVMDGLNCAITPLGGKRGTNAIIEFNEKGKTVHSDFYCMFRDRDFDFPIPYIEELTFDGNKTYCSYRTTIENYLFDIKLFFAFLEEKKLKEIYHIHSEDETIKLFIETAKSIKYYQSVRHTLGKIRFGNSFETTWTKGSGYLPEKLDLDTCKNEGAKLVYDAKYKAQLYWQHIRYCKELNNFVSLFDDTFFTELKFLIYFQGKDFAKALTNKIAGFPLKQYYSFVKEKFDYKKYKDLVELRQIVIAKKTQVNT
jgi:hypothetical protein